MTSRVSERGQITIDRTIRKQLDVKAGMVAYQRVVQGRLEVIFLPESHRKSLFGAFRRRNERPKVVTPDQLEEAVMEAVAEERDRIEHGKV